MINTEEEKETVKLQNLLFQAVVKRITPTFNIIRMLIPCTRKSTLEKKLFK